MSSSLMNIMGLNTGVFLKTGHDISPEMSFLSRTKFKPKPDKQVFFLTLILLCSIMIVPAARAGGEEDEASRDFDSLYSGFSDRWSGAYLGASLGTGWGRSSTSYDRNGNDHLTPETIDPSGYLAALTLGYNFRVGGNLVVGVEGDLGIMDIDAADRTNMWDDHIWKSQYGGMWGTVRGRLGYSLGKMMLFGTGGLAFMETSEKILGDNDATQNTYNEGVLTGWVLGGGLEYAFSDKISTKVEYLHMNFPKYTGYTNNEESYTFENEVDLVRVGLNYKF